MTESPSLEVDIRAVEAEQALLGACIVNAEAIDVVDGIVTPDDFHSGLHADLYATMIEFRHAGRKLDIKQLIALIGRSVDQPMPGFDSMTPAQYYALLAAEAITILNARDFALTIRDCANYRRLADTAAQMKERFELGFGGGDPATIASAAISELDEIVSASQPKGTRRMTAKDAGDAAFRSMIDLRANGRQTGLTWGLRDLDRATLGLHPGQLIVLAARPGMGKSTMAVTAALAAARAQKGVTFFSLEMTGEELGVRMLSDLAYSSIDDHVTYQKMLSGDVTDSEVDRIEDARQRMSGMPIVIDQQGGLSVAQIAARTRITATKMARKGIDLGCVIVDHIGKMSASQRYAGSRTNEIGEITDGLKNLAKELNIPVLALCQLNRGVEQRDNKRPKLSDLRESGRIEEDADMVIFLYRDAYYLELEKFADPDRDAQRVSDLQAKQHDLEINIAKQRQGPTRMIDAFVHMPSSAIRNKDRFY